MPFLRSLLFLLPLLAGCTSYPDLDDRITREAHGAPYPSLVPITDITSRRALARTTGLEGPALSARAAALRARAALLRGITIDEQTRLRLAPTLTRLGG